MKKCKNGFTLAEVLITLGIIGVVAALTIPTLINNSQNAALYDKFLKSYSVITQAYASGVDKYGNAVSAFGESQANFADAFTQGLKVTKKCAVNSDNSCWPAIKDLSTTGAASSLSDEWQTNDTAILVDGTAVLLAFNYLACADPSSAGICGIVLINTNGIEKPNIIGRDIFGMYVTKNGLRPFGDMKDDMWGSGYCDPAGAADGFAGMGCAARVIQDHGIKY